MRDDGGNERLIAFTDGVLSISMTLLVLDIRLPIATDSLSDAALWAALVGIDTHLYAYALSFLVVATFWIGHRRALQAITRSSVTLIWLNIFFLLLIGLVPFTTQVLADNGRGLSTALYAADMAACSLLLAAISVHAETAGLGAPHVAAHRWQDRISRFGVGTMFLLSIPVAFWDSSIAKYLWLLLIPLNLVRQRARRDSA
jgi:uncharacterized membrane protein